MKYRKKPVVIEAMQFVGCNTQELMDWVGTDITQPTHLKFTPTGTPIIRTLEGDHYVSMGDYVIRGIQGEHYPCKPDIFEETYEAATDD